ncbi:dnaJ homolog subfamily C member 24-like [Babylonia areolata]|uniref:dnaJ homolog subfamily C member 24-like n=1 Tax=Babylonia areolata TaxID=304850 RepID=UPI003FD4ECF8
MQDLYSILQCDPQASLEEIKQSFKRLALQHHPDKGQCNDGAMFARISSAWEVLKDAELRHEYDVKWREWCSAQHLPIQEVVDFSSLTKTMRTLSTLAGVEIILC